MSQSYQTILRCATGAQQIPLPLAFEPELLYQPEKLTVPGRFALCSRTHGKDSKIHQDIFDVSQLEWAISQVEKMPERHRKHFWISQATLAPWAVNRRISSIMLLNAIWVDIDLAHPPKSFAGLAPQGSPEVLAARLGMQLQDKGLPPPSLIVSTGGGLCAKYLFELGLPSTARARWQSVQRHFMDLVGNLDHFDSLESRWPVDYSVGDAARILRLVGSDNPRWALPCRVVWGNGQRYDFDYLADHLLPYTRQEVADFKANLKVYKGWDANRAAASAVGIRKPRASALEATKAEQISDEAARSLWNSRFEFGRAVLQARGGAQEGQRNNHFWPMANALAWSCTGAEELTKELSSLHQSFFKAEGWTQAEAMRTAGSVMRRLKNGNPYKMKTPTFLEKLEVTSGEMEAFSGFLGTSKHNIKRSEWNAGAMGFEPMKDLSSADFIVETRRRQALAGARSAEVRGAPANAHGQDVRAKAVLMKNSGLSTRQIAQEIGVSQKTVSNWTRGE